MSPQLLRDIIRRCCRKLADVRLIVRAQRPLSDLLASSTLRHFQHLPDTEISGGSILSKPWVVDLVVPLVLNFLSKFV